MLVHYKHLNEAAIRPDKAHPTDAGLDLYASEPVKIEGFGVVPTGLSIRIPQDHMGLVCSRSGLAASGVFVLNAPGIIDYGYHGEVKVVIGTLSKFPVWINVGDKIAQLLIMPVEKVNLLRGDSMIWESSLRKENGFGSSGDRHGNHRGWLG